MLLNIKIDFDLIQTILSKLHYDHLISILWKPHTKYACDSREWKTESVIISTILLKPNKSNYI